MLRKAFSQIPDTVNVLSACNYLLYCTVYKKCLASRIQKLLLKMWMQVYCHCMYGTVYNESVPSSTTPTPMVETRRVILIRVTTKSHRIKAT
jgi:hypothetical protein